MKSITFYMYFAIVLCCFRRSCYRIFFHTFMPGPFQPISDWKQPLDINGL